MNFYANTLKDLASLCSLTRGLGVCTCKFKYRETNESQLQMCSQQRFRSDCAFVLWLESSLGTFSIAIDAKFLHEDDDIGIEHGFACRFCGRCWKLRPEAAVFNSSQGTCRMLMHWKTMFDRYYCIKTENICYISHYFLHYFVLPFHRCLANVISMD